MDLVISKVMENGSYKVYNHKGEIVGCVIYNPVLSMWCYMDAENVVPYMCRNRHEIQEMVDQLGYDESKYGILSEAEEELYARMADAVKGIIDNTTMNELHWELGTLEAETCLTKVLDKVCYENSVKYEMGVSSIRIYKPYAKEHRGSPWRKS